MLYDSVYRPAPHLVQSAAETLTRVHVYAAPLLRTGVEQILAGSRFVLAEPALLNTSQPSEVDDCSADLFIVDSTERLDETSYLIAELKLRNPTARVIILADHFDIDEVTAARLAGADGFCLTSASRDVLVRSIELVMLGEIVIPSELVLALIESTAHIGDQPLTPCLGMFVASAPERPLSSREIQVLNLLREGAPNKVIARELDLAEATVKVHVKTILRKIGVRNRAQAALWAAYHLTGDATVE